VRGEIHTNSNNVKVGTYIIPSEKVRCKSAAQTSAAQKGEKQTIFKIRLFDPNFLKNYTDCFARRQIQMEAAGLKL
jgi:hypothetical protein